MGLREALYAGTNEAITVAIDVCRKAAAKDRKHAGYGSIWASTRPR
jgi:hypothetical protein